MAYDEALAERIRAVLASRDRITEKKMFGGIAFFSDGKMLCGLAKGELMVRVGPAFAALLAEPHVRPMTFTGRPMKGYVTVDPPGYRTKTMLEAWLARALDFTATIAD